MSDPSVVRRPTAVTMFGWFFKAGGALGMVLALPLAIWGRDLFVDYWAEPLQRLNSLSLFLWYFISSLLGMLLGHGILKGLTWARTLALAYCVVATVIGFLGYSDPQLARIGLISNLVFMAVMGFFLFFPPAAAFLRQEEQPVG